LEIIIAKYVRLTNGDDNYQPPAPATGTVAPNYLIDPIEGNDAIWGRGGNDSIYGGNGSDTIHGGSGNDFIDGDGYAPNAVVISYGYSPVANQTLVGSVITFDGTINITGTLDIIQGALNIIGDVDLTTTIISSDSTGNLLSSAKVPGSSTLNDVLYGDTGNDMMFGGPGNDLMYGDNETIITATLISGTTYNTYNDTMSGQDGSDTMIGGIGTDKLYGGNGNDVLSGGSGSDFLKGEAGNDLLNGGSGADTLEGGDGKDIFQFTNAASSSYIDKLLDFNGSQDVIQLSSRVFTAFYGSEGSQADVLSAPVPSGTSTTTIYKSIAGDSDYLFYNVTNQTLYYDADAIGSKSGLVPILTIGVPVFDPSTIHVDIVY